MYPSDTDNSDMFKVDHSTQHQHEAIEKRMENMFDKDKEILHAGQKRVVVYGALEQQPRTIYQIVQPYLFRAAAVTGQAAIYAGKNIFSALTTGASWVYDKFVNRVIPYTQEELPKLLFIIRGGKKNEPRVVSSDSFHVLEIGDGDYDEIKKKEKAAGKGKNKKRVVVPLGPNQDPEFAKFLEKQKYVPDTSFPIDADQDESETLMIPSANFMALHDEAIKKNLPKPIKNLEIEHHETQQIQVKPMQQNQPEAEPIPEQNPGVKSIVEELAVKEVQNYKRVQKKVFKLKDCYIFELEGKNSIEYELLDGIEKDQQVKCGYLVKSNNFDIAKEEHQSSDGSGQVPMVIDKVVEAEMKVRVQIPKEKNNQQVYQSKKEEKLGQFYLA